MGLSQYSGTCPSHRRKGGPALVGELTPRAASARRRLLLTSALAERGSRRSQIEIANDMASNHLAGVVAKEAVGSQGVMFDYEHHTDDLMIGCVSVTWTPGSAGSGAMPGALS